MRSILELRRMLSISRQEMASRLDVEESMLRKVESGQYSRSEKLTGRVGVLLNTSKECAADLLFTDTVPKSVLKRLALQEFKRKLEEWK